MVVRGGAAYTLKVTKAAESDIDDVCGEDDELFDAVWLYVRELKNDQELLEKLLEDRYGKLRHEDRFTHRIGVQQIGEFFRDRPARDTWAWKFWDIENKGVALRFVYMYLPRQRWFIVLAVAKREWNYESSHPLSDRIRADYDRFKRNYG
ncbi:hypothetical protein D7Y24_19405 [Stenotrophomonas maltophilia]|uniref:hypothetical protein n=1 Tax=Stenotrophomonas TaxID=40323 RepID=UPI0015DE19D6|nr:MULTISPECIES: hypothetical protein [Stenotrophomonas]ELN2584890.1 hypothetical protein [Stenotrophomonas maltophilia]ELN2592905.1 hypothetical protein [Stenotrophomonas maltophilia]MBA0300572.1 hypothetical protein [Stenotrophomonas maltophilia]MBH1400400.1 hypothetical protein [Stenotrophomonas maltophilia]MBH1703072.1 hypothetical protein [Stenotrophomonas maltophilia]